VRRSAAARMPRADLIPAPDSPERIPDDCLEPALALLEVAAVAPVAAWLRPAGKRDAPKPVRSAQGIAGTIGATTSPRSVVRPKLPQPARRNSKTGQAL
jgi:hypothetical protein